MWIPIGGFAIGYLGIIVVFAGFAGMLARFRSGAFSGAEDAGIGEWIGFAFFRALAQDYPGIVPVSPAAWLLVGVQVILAVGWALVVFAAVIVVHSATARADRQTGPAVDRKVSLRGGRGRGRRVPSSNRPARTRHAASRRSTAGPKYDELRIDKPTKYFVS